MRLHTLIATLVCFLLTTTPVMGDSSTASNIPGTSQSLLPDGFANRITLTDDQGDYPLGLQLAILEDADKSLTIESVTTPDVAARFQPSTKAVPGFGFTASAYWVRVLIDRDTRQEQIWRLDFGYIPMQWVDVYTVTADGKIHHQRGGSGVAYKDRPYPHHRHIFPLQLPNQQTTALFVRVDSEGSKTIPLRLYSADAFADASGAEIATLSIYAGVILALLCYNLFIFYSIREPAYLYYVLFLAFFLLTTMSLNGVTQSLVFPWWPDIGLRIIPWSMGGVGAFAGLFTLSFLNTGHHFRLLHRFVQSIVAWGSIALLLPFFTSYKVAILTSTLLAVYFPSIVLIVASIAVFKIRNYAARYFLLAWCLLLIGILLNALRLFGVISTFSLTEYGYLWGSAAEAILLSVALAARMRVMKDEKDRAQHEHAQAQQALLASQAETVAAQQLAIANHERALKHQQTAYENQQRALDSERTAVENLQRLDKLKDEFLANTSHELRTPLNGIIGLAEATLHDTRAPLNDLQRSNLGMIVTSGRRLGALVNDILDFSKLRHEDIVLSPKVIDARSLADVVLTLSRPLIQGRAIALLNAMPDKLPPVMADENRVQQILHNLVGNALKFTREGSVQVTAEVMDQRLVIAISDTGIGIPAERIDSIFDSFNQGDGSIQREFGGTGLGLSITRKLVELHGGSITVTSTPGEGSTFRFSLPLASGDSALPVTSLQTPLLQPQPAPTVIPAGVAANDDPTVPASEADVHHQADDHRQASHRVLVVDDEPINRQVLRAQLSSAGFAVVEAVDGEDALRRLEETGQAFDLVLLDVMMPKLSGFDTCTRLRASHPALSLPVIFLTAKSQTEDVLAGFAAGGNDYLIKPFSRDELLARIRIHLELITTHRIIREYSKGLEDKVADRTRALMDAQQQLVLKQKQAALGVLTAGVAHEINNPNNFVQVALQNTVAWKERFETFVGELLDEEADPEISQAFHDQLNKLNEQLGLIDTGSRRIDAIVKGLRVITRLDEAERQDANPVEGLLQTIELLKPSVGDRAVFHLDVVAQPTLRCWPAELNQVFMNVLVNAVHAIEDKGQPTSGAILVSTQATEDRLDIVIRDEGVGMAKDVLERACDPFYTTRPVGSGAGLGLSISRDIVVKHGGELLIDSTPGQGTQVVVRLPLTTSH